MIDERLRPQVEKIWRYHHLDHQLFRADAILVLCSHDQIVAVRGAELFLDGWAPMLIFSGGLGMITKHLWRAGGGPVVIAIGTGVLADDGHRERSHQHRRERPIINAGPNGFDLHFHRRAEWSAVLCDVPEVWPEKRGVTSAAVARRYLAAALTTRCERRRHEYGGPAADPALPAAGG
jgi:hypothetical protein